MKPDNLLLELLLQNSRVIIQTRSISATFGDAKSAFNIQKECFGTNLQRYKDFEDRLCYTSNSGGFAANIKDLLAGYVLFENRSSYLRLTEIAVHPHAQKMGVGKALVSRVKGKLLCSDVMKYVELNIDEQNTGGHCFFESQGFVGSRDTSTSYKFRFLSDWLEY